MLTIIAHAQPLLQRANLRPVLEKLRSKGVRSISDVRALGQLRSTVLAVKLLVEFGLSNSEAINFRKALAEFLESEADDAVPNVASFSTAAALVPRRATAFYQVPKNGRTQEQQEARLARNAGRMQIRRVALGTSI